MKILILNAADSGGGAAIAARNLAVELNRMHIDIELWVIKKTSELAFIKQQKVRKKGRIIQILDKASRLLKTTFKSTNPILHSENLKSKVSIEAINNSNFDLVHFHWINHDMISIEDIAKITKPIVWTLHDSWVFCGAEHHPNFIENDRRYIEGYTSKNMPVRTRGGDICRRTWERKLKSWKNQKFNFISPSIWLKERLQESYLFKNAECHVIPNIVPQSMFYKRSKESCREAIGLDRKKIIIGFGAADGITEQHSIKGGKLLIEALKKLTSIENVELLVFGSASAEFSNAIHMKTFYTGFIQSSQVLAAIYGALDVFVCPSIIENLPTTCIEAQLCGVPVTAFHVGGIPEVVEHKITGYLANPYDTGDLAKGMEFCFSNNEKLSKAAEYSSRKKYDRQTIIKQHIELYEKVLMS